MSRASVVAEGVVLTLDLGTSATKAALWHGAELVGIARVPLTTVAPSPGRAEQNPESWWTSVMGMMVGAAVTRRLMPVESSRRQRVVCQ